MAKNIPSSVRQRLLALGKSTGQDADLIWTRYAIERLLYRLSISEHAGNFTLKGAMLFLAWTGKTHRPTHDLDLLGTGDSSEAQIAKVFERLCEIQCESDGIAFDAATIVVSKIKEDQEYEGHRVTLRFRIDTVEIPLQIDIGFGDVISPSVRALDYPVLIGSPVPHIRGYPPETVVRKNFKRWWRSESATAA